MLSKISALVAIALAAPIIAAWAQDGSAPAPAMAEIAPLQSTPGWTRQGRSLVLYGADGSLSQEVPLSAGESESTSSHEILGGTSPDGRLAWTLDRRLFWTPGKTRVTESRRQLRVFGTTGQELWRDSDADLPERGEPLIFAADGKTLLLTRTSTAGWTVDARDWMGRTLATVGPFPHLITMTLSPNGRFLLARWRVPDSSDTHTFLDLATKKRKDVASSDLVLGLARIGNDGVVRSGSKSLFAFDLSVSSPAATPPP